MITWNFCGKITKSQKAYKAVGVEEDALCVLAEQPAVQLGVGDAQLGPPDHRQVRLVLAVQHVHHRHMVPHGAQLLPGKISTCRSYILMILL